MTYFKKKILISGLLVYLLFLMAGCNVPEKKSADQQMKMSTVYKRFLEFPVPDGEGPVRINPPVLRWPAQKGKKVTYDVRLSYDPDFSENAITYSAEQSPWAMFNPHELLKEGKWYWQYRKTGDSWSETFSFTLDERAMSLLSPVPSVFIEAIPATHPRVLTIREELNTLRSVKDNPDAQAILDEAEKALNSPIWVEKQGIPSQTGADKDQEHKFRQDASQRLANKSKSLVHALTEAWVLKPDIRYAEKAIAQAMEISRWDPDGVSAYSDFADARCMLAMALAYDTFHELLDAKQKKQLLEAIYIRTNRFYNSWTNNIEIRLLSGHVWQHILHYFFQTSLAVYGDIPEAEQWLIYAYELFMARAPVLGGLDGGWIEGVSYFKMNMETMIEIPLFIKKFTGYDYFNVHPWYEKQSDWLIYHIPPGSAADGFGDNTEEINMPGDHYQAFAIELAKLTQNPKAAWYARECARYETYDLSKTRLLRWVRLTQTGDIPLPAAIIDHPLPMTRAFRDVGLVALHTNPENTEENLMVAMRSSPFGCYGHMLADQNVFNILYGGQKLFYRTGYKITMQDPHRTGWYQNTRSQNGILINGEGQPYSTEAFGWIARVAEGGGLAYAKGDASNAYRSTETAEDYGVVKHHRHLVLLQPDVIVVYDDMEAKDPVRWSWLIHSLQQMKVNQQNQRFEVNINQMRATGRLWASQPFDMILTDTFAVPAVNWRGSRDADGQLKSYDADQWHLNISNTENSPAMRFLCIIRIMPDGQLVMHDVKETDGKIELKVGEWEIEATIDYRKQASLIIHNQTTETYFSSHGAKGVNKSMFKKARYVGSTQIEFIQHGKKQFLEVSDEIPYDMLSRFHHYQIQE
ncbi:MAG: DUF4962 domain-containing protein [Cyclobacteriaceae bacterium]|nr:DUF4962 domain-containing protein [Cyclobacteriaceae bacterium]